MTNPGAISVGRDAHGNVQITGSGNTVFVFYGIEPTPELIEQILSGQLHPADAPGAVPLPTLILAIRFTDSTRREWEVQARRQDSEAAPTVQTIATPWHSEAGFAAALDGFWRLSRTVLDSDEEDARLNSHARLLGDALATALSEDDRQFLIAAASGGLPPPFLIIESQDDAILALPWELLRLNGAYAVHDGRLDLARSVRLPIEPAPLGPPIEPARLLVTVSAPSNSGPIDYETESYLITRALTESVPAVINEMGEVGDLIDGLRADPAPNGVHFSGHGGPGRLEFEDAFGEAHSVAIADLLKDIRTQAHHLPRFFYLACCYGGDAPSLPSGTDWLAEKGGVTAAATALHREGVDQVVGYFGPVYDRLSTWASTAFYRELALGRRTRDAVRCARQQMTRPLMPDLHHQLRDAGPATTAGTVPFGWAQLVLYHRGPDHPLGTRVETPIAAATLDTTQRAKAFASPYVRTQVLTTGFVGRRQELHALRRSIRDGRRVHVVQALGGLGKSAFCQEALRVYARLGWQPLALWCREVEGEAEPVGGLLRQLEQIGSEAFGDVFPSALAVLDQSTTQRPDLQQQGQRLVALLTVLVACSPKPVVLSLDNIESLQVGPVIDDSDPDAVASWKDQDCQSLWEGLVELAEAQPDRFAILASGRYRHPDFSRHILPFGPLSHDGLWRLCGWFPTLRRLSGASRGRLVDRLAGHPRALEFLDGLLRSAVRIWEEGHKPLETARNAVLRSGTQADWADREWQEIIAPALPTLTTDLSANMLFDSLWKRLPPTEQDLLVRATVLRRPAERTLFQALCQPAEQDVDAVSHLRDLSLLTEIEERTEDGPIRLLALHQLVRDLALQKTVEPDHLIQDGHRLAGAWFEHRAATSRSWQDDVDGAFHLDAAGEADRAFRLIAPLVQWLMERGRLFDATQALALLQAVETLAGSDHVHFTLLKGLLTESLGNLSGARALYQSSLDTAQRLADADPHNAGWQRDLSVSHNKIGDVLVAQGQLSQALTSFQDSLAIRKRLADADPHNAGWQRDLSVSHNKIGDVLVAQGQLSQALTSFQDSLAIAQRLADADPHNAGWQRDLSVSYEKIGSVLVAQGQLSQALTSFQDSLAIAQRLADADPHNAGWQRDLSVSHNKIGDVLVAQGQLSQALTSFQDSLAIAQRLADADPHNAGWQRDLSVSYEKIGSVLVAQGQLSQALTSFQDSLAIAQRLADADPHNAGWQRDLSVSYDQIGDVLVAQGQLSQALTSFQDSLAIRKRLADADPHNAGWQRDLSVSYEKIGDVLVAQGQLSQALTSFQDSLAIRKRLADADPHNAGWQRDLSVSYDQIGSVLVAQGQLSQALTSFQDSLAIRKRLADADPHNAGWQRDLSVSHNKIGDVLVAQGQLSQALTSFQDSLAIRKRLADADPHNAGWQRDLSVSYDQIGDVLVAQGQLSQALTSFQDSLAIAQRLADADPHNAGWQRDLSVSYEKIGDVLVAQGQLSQALTSFQDSLAIAQRLADADPHNAGWQRDLAASHGKVGIAYRATGNADIAREYFSRGRAIIASLIDRFPGWVQWEADLSSFDGLLAALDAEPGVDEAG